MGWKGGSCPFMLKKQPISISHLHFTQLDVFFVDLTNFGAYIFTPSLSFRTMSFVFDSHWLQLVMRGKAFETVGFWNL